MQWRVERASLTTPPHFPTTPPTPYPCPLPPPSMFPYLLATHCACTAQPWKIKYPVEHRSSFPAFSPSTPPSLHPAFPAFNPSTPPCFQFPLPWPRLHPVYLDFPAFHLDCNCITSSHRKTYYLFMCFANQPGFACYILLGPTMLVPRRGSK